MDHGGIGRIPLGGIDNGTSLGFPERDTRNDLAESVARLPETLFEVDVTAENGPAYSTGEANEWHDRGECKGNSLTKINLAFMSSSCFDWYDAH